MGYFDPENIFFLIMQITNLRGDLTDISASKAPLVPLMCVVRRIACVVGLRHCRAVLLFSKLNKMFFGYCDPDNILLDNENK